MLQGLAKSICVNAKKTAADNTPAAVNWADTTAFSAKKTWNYTYTAQQITGISTSITLQTEFSNNGYLYLYYKVQSTNTVPAVTSAPTSNSYTNIQHNGTITVSNNEWVVFCGAAGGNNVSATVTVKNTSDGNATLDTFYSFSSQS